MAKAAPSVGDIVLTHHLVRDRLVTLPAIVFAADGAELDVEVFGTCGSGGLPKTVEGMTPVPKFDAAKVGRKLAIERKKRGEREFSQTELANMVAMAEAKAKAGHYTPAKG